MHNLIHPSTSINHDDYSQNQFVHECACTEMKLISDVIACSCNVVNITSCPVSLLSDWLARRTGRRSYGDRGLISIACVTNHFLFTMFWSHSLFMWADLPCSKIRRRFDRKTHRVATFVSCLNAQAFDWMHIDFCAPAAECACSKYQHHLDGMLLKGGTEINISLRVISAETHHTREKINNCTSHGNQCKECRRHTFVLLTVVTCYND